GLEVLGLALQALFQVLAEANVVEHLAVAPQLARVVLDRDDDAGGPEAAAVFADVPAVVLGPPFDGRFLQLPFRDAPLDVFLRENAGERLADDLGLCI